jgi:hypothetical protein
MDRANLVSGRSVSVVRRCEMSFRHEGELTAFFGVGTICAPVKRRGRMCLISSKPASKFKNLPRNGTLLTIRWVEFFRRLRNLPLACCSARPLENSGQTLNGRGVKAAAVRTTRISRAIEIIIFSRRWGKIH